MPKDWSGSRVDVHLALPVVGARRANLEHALRDAIRDGRLAAGALLPSTRGLALELGLSRGTVTAAYGQLVEEGYLTAHPGSGTTVADLPPRPASTTTAAARNPVPQNDLRPGSPDVSAFPVRAWLAATRRVLGAAGPHVFGPGDPQGAPQLRHALADYLGRTRGVLTTPDRIVITSGDYQGLSLLASALTASGATTAAVEDPGHSLFRDVVRRSGLTIAPLPVDARGARVDLLTDRIDAVFLTPAHQYPMGVPLHPHRRRTLSAWTNETASLVVEDDYDGEYRYDRQPVGAFQAMAPDTTVYCGSASKTLGPALRLAWIVLPPHLVGPVVQAKHEADLYTETLGQLVLADLIATHAYDRHIRAARHRYRRRRELLIQRVHTIPGLTVHGVPAGLHTLLTGTEDWPDEPTLLAACEGHGVALRALADHYCEPDRSVPERPPGLVVGFGAPTERAFPSAVEALHAVLTRSDNQPGDQLPS